MDRGAEQVTVKYPWEPKQPERPRQSCQVARPSWYKSNTGNKPIADWTDQELADEREIVKAKMIFEQTKVKK